MIPQEHRETTEYDSAPVNYPSDTDYFMEPPECHIFFFVNPTAGGNTAMSVLKPGVTRMELACSTKVHLFFFDIREPETGKHPGFLQLKSLVDSIKKNKLDTEKYNALNDKQQPLQGKVLAVAAGGDGTVMFLVSQVFAYNVDSDYVVFGVIPYGTGNDFARAFGWNALTFSKLFTEDLTSLRKLIEQWMSGCLVWNDVWDIIVVKHPNGVFQKIDSSTREKQQVQGRISDEYPPSLFHTPSDEADTPTNYLCLRMCNYFSTGVESRIGIGFERNRTKHTYLNKLRYIVEGLKKTLLKRNVHISKKINGLVMEDDDPDTFQPRLVSVFSDPGIAERKLHQCQSIIVSNLPSFAAGMNIWDASPRWGLNGYPDPHTMTGKQKIGDGVLEITAFRTMMGMMMSRFISGQGMRICQGRGPFCFRFSNSEDTVNPERVYFQVDGEFFVATLLKEIHIKCWKRIKVIASKRSPMSRFYTSAD